MYTCGRVGYPATVQLLLPEFLQYEKLRQATQSDIATTLTAAAALHLHLTERDVSLLLNRTRHALPKAEPEDASGTLCGFAALRCNITSLNIDRLVSYLQNHLHNCSMQDVAAAVCACCRMQYAPLPLLSELEQHPELLRCLLNAAVPRELAMLAAACGKLGYVGIKLPGVPLQQAVQVHQDSSTASSCNMQDICELCWAAAVLDLQQYVPQVLQLAAMCTHDIWDTTAGTGSTSRHIHQLYQVHLWLLDSQLPGPGWGLSGVLSQQQLQQCRDSWEQQLAAPSSSSSSRAAQSCRLQKSVCAALTSLRGAAWQQPPMLDQRTADGALSIDIAATTVSGVRLAIQVHGVCQYIWPKRSYDGPTLFKNRALAARGYVLVSILYWQWGRLGGRAQQQQYSSGQKFGQLKCVLQLWQKRSGKR